MRNKMSVGFGAALMAGFVLAFSVSLKAQSDLPSAGEQSPQPLPPQLVPRSGTFWSLTLSNFPPSPFLPLPRELDIPVYALAKGTFLYDDRWVDYIALRAQASEGVARRNASPGDAMPLSQDVPPLPGGGTNGYGGSDTNCTPRVYGYPSNTLYVEILDLSNSAMHLLIHGTASNGIYDLYWTETLGSNYIHIMRTEPGDTNLTLAMNNLPSGFLMLGTQMDSDGDSIPDAYENLVSLSDPALADTAATLGNQANLIAEVPSELRILQAKNESHYTEHWFPCHDSIFPEMYDEYLNWRRGVGGTNVFLAGFVHCVGGNAVADWVPSTNTWDGNAAWMKYSWHLESPHTDSGYMTKDDSAEVKIDFATGGPPLSTKVWPYVISGSALEVIPNWTWPPYQYTNAVPYTNISIAGGALNAEGQAAVNLRDNTTNDFTPTVFGVNNYRFSVAASKLLVQLVFRNGGSITARETTNLNGVPVGYQASIYDAVTNALQTSSLGVSAITISGRFQNIQETDAFVPSGSLLNTGWRFHRDVADRTFLWVPVIPDQTGPLADQRDFSQGSAGEGEGNDSGGGAADETPDANRLILTVDGPGFVPPLPSDRTLPSGSVLAFRFYAREWLTWNGPRVSQILRWRCFITIRRKSDYTWERKGPNLLELVPEGISETPTMTAEEMKSIGQLP